MPESIVETPRKTIHQAVLGYPASWSPSALMREVGDEEEKIETEVSNWLTGLGLMESEKNRTIIAATRIGLCSDALFPTGLPSRFIYLAKLFNIWFLYDDSTEGIGVTGREESIVRALAAELESAPPDGTELRGWWELGQDFSRLMSPAWAHRNSRRFGSWMASLKDEADLLTPGRQPGQEEQLAVHSKTIGISTFLDLIEFACGREVPEAAFWNLDFIEISHLSNQLASLDNDLHCLENDRGKGWHNSILSAAQDKNLSLPEAFDAITGLHDVLVARFLRAEARLRANRELDLAWWIDAVHHVLAGLVVWMRETPRYSASHDLGGGETVRVSMTFAP